MKTKVTFKQLYYSPTLEKMDQLHSTLKIRAIYTVKKIIFDVREVGDRFDLSLERFVSSIVPHASHGVPDTAH
jgi:hypothetical protein